MGFTNVLAYLDYLEGLCMAVFQAVRCFFPNFSEDIFALTPVGHPKLC